MKTRYYVERYSKLQDLCVDKKFSVTKLYVEVSTLGVLLKNIQNFRNLCKQYDSKYVMRMVKKLSEVAMKNFFIYTRRNKE